jgi:hypothetical protein
MFVKNLCTFCEKISFKLMLFELRISFCETKKISRRYWVGGGRTHEGIQVAGARAIHES